MHIMSCLWLADVGGVGGPLSIVRRPGLADISSVVPWEAGHELRSQSRLLRMRWPACALLGWILTRQSGLSAGQKTLGQ